MCGRYYIDDTMFREVESDFPELAVRGREAGDITPAGTADVILAPDGRMRMDADMVWGFPVKGSLLINARSETAFDRPSFRDSVRSRRCLIPAAGFYERDREKNLVSFTRDGRGVIYLAGCYNLFSEGVRFVILTTGANDSMMPVHDRMPLMIEPEDARVWLFDARRAAELMRRPMPAVTAHRKYEQQTFDFL